MGLFSKKADPIASREKALSKEIAALEAEIRQLHSQTAKPPERRPIAQAPAPVSQIQFQPHSAPQPQIPTRKIAAREPIFESVEQAPPVPPGQDGRGHFNELGVSLR